MAGSTGSIRVPRRRCRSRRPVRGATPTCGRTSPAAASTRSARTTPSTAEPANTIVTIPLDGGDPQVLVKGSDFIAAPRLSPDGTRLAWLEWDHPDMPWDATRLRVAAFEADGTLGEAMLAAGGPDESIVQPEWAPDGTLHLISDRSGWWNLYRLVDGPRLEPLAAMEAEFADPAWIFDRSTYGFLPDGAIVAVARADGRDHLFRLEPGTRIGELEIPFTELDGLQVGATRRRRPRRPGRANRPSSPASTR